MGKRLFVGNLPYSATADELRALFSEHGEVTDVHIVIDRETTRPRGFAFVSYATDEQAAQAAQRLNGHSFGGRQLVVNEARERGAEGPPSGPRPPRPGGGPGGPRPGGFSPRPGGPPRGPRMPILPAPEELPQEEGRRRQPAKKRTEPERDRAPKRVRDETPKTGGWRQWIEDEEDEG